MIPALAFISLLAWYVNARNNFPSRIATSGASAVPGGTSPARENLPRGSK